MKKLLFVARKMSVGGIETSLVNLLNFINKEHKEEYDITLFTFAGGKLLESIPENVRVITAESDLNLISSSFNEVLKSQNPFKIFKRIYFVFYASTYGSDRLYSKLLKKHTLYEKFHAAISYYNDNTNMRFSRGTNMFVSDFTDADKKVAWIHTDPELCGFDRNYCLNLYEKFDKIFCVSKAVKNKFCKLLPEYENKTEVFYNIFPKDEIIAKADEYVPFEKGCFDIVTVGRIDNDTKRIDLIVRLCKRLKDDGVCNFRWRIIGGGADLKSNVKLAKELDVSDLLEFTGEKINPYPYIKNSDLFALYSAYEGHPMVIGEAEVLGTFIITKNYAAAYEQISENTGIICEDDETFYNTLKNLILKKAGEKC